MSTNQVTDSRVPNYAQRFAYQRNKMQEHLLAVKFRTYITASSEQINLKEWASKQKQFTFWREHHVIIRSNCILEGVGYYNKGRVSITNRIIYCHILKATNAQGRNFHSTCRRWRPITLADKYYQTMNLNCLFFPFFFLKISKAVLQAFPINSIK